MVNQLCELHFLSDEWELVLHEHVMNVLKR